VRKVAGVICCGIGLWPAGALAGSFTIAGHGWGHGVGMSQWGAEGYAQHGWTYRRILAHYYPGTRLRDEGAITVRVLLAEGRRTVTIGSSAPFRVRAHGKMRTVAAGRHRFRGTLVALPGTQPLTLDGAGYRGELHVRGGTVINVLPLERYLRGVVPWEMPNRWNAEALEAQAVAARSYALATLKHGQSFDLYADTRDQVYGGIRAESASTNAAIGATAGQVLTWDGRPALTYYFSTSGGRTATSTDSLPWAPRVPYLVSVSDPYDALSPHHSWTLRFARPKLGALLHLPGVRRIELERNASGRVAQVWVRWRGGTTAIAGRTFQSDLDLPSTWFSVAGAKTTAVSSAPAPARATGWIVVLSSDPAEGSARAQAQRLGAHVLRSDDYPTLNPGYWVVYRGPYATRAAAAGVATGGAYVRSLTRG
jgi:stage II sporulation protein D